MLINDKLCSFVQEGFMTFSEQCIYVRTKLLLTQKNLADFLGVSTITISRWETQDRKPRAIQYGKFLSFCENKGIFFDKKTGDVL